MLPLLQLQIDIINACNLRCIHCRVPEDTRVNEDLPKELFCNVISQARELGAEDLLIGGGEPMLRRDWDEMARHARDLGYDCITLLTNGTVFKKQGTPERIQAAGVSEVQISLDGPTPEVHDYFRGKPGCFEIAVRAVRQLVEAGVSTSITMTVTDYNVAHAEALVELGYQLGVGQVTLRRFIPQGYGFDYAVDLLPITREQTEALLERHLALVEKYGDQMVVSLALFPFTVLNEPGLLEEFREEIRQGACGGCSAGVAAMYVDPAGIVTPCPHVPVALGNVAEHTLEEIWLRHPVMRQLRDRSQLGGACGTCSHQNLCGGCRAYPLALTGDLMGFDPYCSQNRDLAMEQTNTVALRTLPPPPGGEKGTGRPGRVALPIIA